LGYGKTGSRAGDSDISLQRLERGRHDFTRRCIVLRLGRPTNEGMKR